MKIASRTWRGTGVCRVVLSAALLVGGLAFGEQTQCIYDVLGPAGTVRRFTSIIDLTGGGATTCPAATSALCPVGTRANNFPDGFGSTTAGAARLDGTCVTPSMYVRPSLFPNLTRPDCLGANCRELTKTQALPLALFQCSVFSDPNVALPRIYVGNDPCLEAGVYESITSRAVFPGPALGPSRKYLSVGSTVCPGPATPTPVSTAPTGTPELFSALPPSGTNPGQWANLGGITCSSGAPCALYLTSATPTSVLTDRAWYAFFDESFMPAPGQTSPLTVPGYPLSSATGSTSYVTPVLTRQVTVPPATPCLATGRLVSGESLATFGITQAVLQANVILNRGTRIDESPTRSGSSYVCTAAWPCDVQALPDVFIPPVSSQGRTLYNPALLTAPSRFATGTTVAMPTATVPYTLRLISPALTTCPVLGTTSVDPAPAGTVWQGTLPTGCAGAGPCQFALPTQGLATASPNICLPPLSRFNALPANALAPCSFNGRDYTRADFATDESGSPLRTTLNIPVTLTCTTGTFTVTSLAGYTGNVTAGAAPNEATLVFVSSSAGAPEVSSPGVDLTNPPAGYPPNPATTTSRGGVTQTPAPVAGSPSDPTGGCLGSVGTNQQSSDASLCAGVVPCTLLVLGPVQTSATCGTLGTSPCFACQYQPRSYTWARPTTDCAYSATRTQWAVDPTAVTCTYARPEWRTEVLTPGRKICGYSVGARRSDFSAPSETFCEYFAVQTTLTSQRTLYTYEYLTIGSEPIGRALSTTVAGNLCASVWSPASALGVACPETVAGCTGLTSITPEASLLLSTSTCRLKIGGTSSTLSSTPDPNLGTHVIRSQADQGNLGRFTNFRAGVDQPYTIVDENHRACGAVVPPVDPDSYKDELAAPRGFCAAIGTGVGDGGVDAGALGGPSADAGSAGDAGQLAGTEADAGQSLDAGTVTDAGNELDSGRQTEADAGTSTVAGVYAVGCGCSESPGALGFALFLLISSRTAAPRARRR